MAQSITRLPVLHSGPAPELVLMHGWGMSSLVWQPWLPTLRQHCHISLVDLPGYGKSDAVTDLTIEQWLGQCLEQLPEKAFYLGYSLGGMLATQVARRYPERVVGLVTLAANARFVSSESWPEAMPSETFREFYALVTDKPLLALKKFCGLQLHGYEGEKKLLKSLRAAIEDFSCGVLVDSLDWLDNLDNLTLDKTLTTPRLHIFGSEDSLVPIAAARRMQSASPSRVAIIEGAPHALFLSHPQQCWQVIEPFIQQLSGLLSDLSSQPTLQPLPQQVSELEIRQHQPRSLDKIQVARSFSRAASTYDSVADLQRRVGEALLQLLPAKTAGLVVDLGCGTGFFTLQLQQAFPSAQVVGVDLAEGMVKHAASHYDGAYWLCGDAENMPLTSQSVDVIFSSLAIQWCEDYERMFAELFRVLKPGGSLLISTLGPETLHELRSAWSVVDSYTHVNRFVGSEPLEQAISESGFRPINGHRVLHEDIITLQYDSLKTLTRELKSLGAHNVNKGRPEGLTGKQRIRSLMAAYDQQRNDQGKLPATYQCWYVQLIKPLKSRNG